MKVWTILIVVFFCLASFCEGQMAKQGMPTLTQQKKPSPFGDPKELIFREDKGRWITVYPQDNGILNWLSEDYLHRVLVTHRSKFNDVSAFMIPKEYRGKVALFSGISKDEKTLKLLIIPTHVAKGQSEKLLEVAVHIKFSLSSPVTVDWEVLRELPLPTSADPSQKTTWKYLLSAQPPSSSDQQTTTQQIKTLYLVAKDKVVFVHYRKWQVIGTQPIPRADITSAVVMPDTLYLASQVKTGEGKNAPTSVDIFKLAGTRKDISLSKVAIIPENKIHQLCYVQSNGNPSICNWFYMDIESDTHILSIHDIVQQAANSHGPITLSTNTSIVFTDFASLPYDMLIAHGPLDAPIGLGGFILRKFKTRPVPEISSDVKFVDFNLLPRLAVQLKDKGTTGRVVFGSITRRGYSELVFYTYNMDKEPKKKKTNEQQEDVTLVDTPKNKAELIAEMQEVPNIMWPQRSNRKLLELDEQDATETQQPQQPQQQGRNFTHVSMKIVLDDDFLSEPDNNYDDSLPFSCKEQGCGPDVKCPDATPTRQCFLYNDAFLCCHQSPFG